MGVQFRDHDSDNLDPGSDAFHKQGMELSELSETRGKGPRFEGHRRSANRNPSGLGPQSPGLRFVQPVAWGALARRERREKATGSRPPWSRKTNSPQPNP